MRFLIILALASVSFGSTVSRSLTKEIDDYVRLEYEDVDLEGDFAEISPLLDLSSTIRDAVLKFQNQMPCGFPGLHIPPLAPFKKEFYQFDFEKGVLQTVDNLYKVRVDGLNDFDINEAKINVFKRKINFDLKFPNIQASAVKYESDTIVDALSQLGISVQYEGDGSLNFGLRNLRIQGVIRYKMPLLWGSMQVTSLKTTVTLQNVESNITGFVGDGAFNRFVNSQIENIVEKSINENEEKISDYIEEKGLPKINSRLKGNTIWAVIDNLLSKIGG